MENPYDVAMDRIEDVLRWAGLLVYFSRRDLERFPKRWVKRGCPDLEHPEVMRLRARIAELEREAENRLETQRCIFEDKLSVWRGQISRLMVEKDALNDVCEDRKRVLEKQDAQIAGLKEEISGVHEWLRRSDSLLHQHQNRGVWERGKDLWCCIIQRLSGIWR